MSHWAPDFEDHGGVRSARVTPGMHLTHLVHLDVDDCDADTAFMLIDLSDAAKWPHTETGHIHLEGVDVHINPDDTFTGDIKLGFLSAVDATDGDLNIIHTWHFEKDRTTMQDHLNLWWRQVHCDTSEWFGPTDANVALFQTDVNIQGPDGAVNYPSGDGDLVLRVQRTAGTIDIGITVAYETHE